MPTAKDRHHRRSTRLKGYDYASAGAYFVTICVDGREPVLGEVMDDQVLLSEWGRVVDDFWTRLPAHFPDVSVDTHVTMPNHIHAIIIHQNISGTAAVAEPSPPTADHPDRGAETAPRGASPAKGGGTPPLRDGRAGMIATPTITRPTLGQVVAYFKYQTTRTINQMRGAPGVRFWQRNYYDTIIRNQRQLDALRKYIHQNPAQWALDTENPDRVRGEPR